MNFEKFSQENQNEEIIAAEAAQQDMNAEKKEKTLLEKFGDYKRAFALSLGLSVLGASFEALKPAEVYAGFNNNEDKIESSVQETKLLESKQFITKDGYQAKYREGESKIVVDGKEFNVRLTGVEAVDEGNPEQKGDENIYKAEFTRYSIDGKENIDSKTSAVLSRGIENPYKENEITEKMMKEGKTHLARQLLRNNLTKIYSETFILKVLKEAGKNNTPEYKFSENNVKRHIEKIIEQYGSDAIKESAFEEMIGK